MKIMLILFSIGLVLITAPALKRINLLRFFTVVLLLVYGMGIIQLILLYPIPSFLTLGAGMLAVLCTAFLFRQGTVVRPVTKHMDRKIRILNWHRRDINTGIKNIHPLNGLERHRKILPIR